MSFSLGAVLVQHRAPPLPPRTREETLGDATWDPATEPPNPAEPILAALYRGAVRFTDGTTHVHHASSRDAEHPAVLFHRRCVVVFDYLLPHGCEWEAAGVESRLDARLATLSSSPDVERVMVAYLDGISGTYAFAVFAAGTRVRRWTHMPSGDSIVSLDEGAPLATETPGDPQARIDSASRTLLEDRGLLAVASEHDGPVFVCERAPR